MKVYVGNLHNNVNEEQLRALFKPYGMVRSVNILMDMEGMSKGFGFVEMDEKNDAVRAIKHLNGSTFAEQEIVVSEAINKDNADNKYLNAAREKKAAQPTGKKR